MHQKQKFMNTVSIMVNPQNKQNYLVLEFIITLLRDLWRMTSGVGFKNSWFDVVTGAYITENWLAPGLRLDIHWAYS